MKLTKYPRHYINRFFRSSLVAVRDTILITTINPTFASSSSTHCTRQNIICTIMLFSDSDQDDDNATRPAPMAATIASNVAAEPPENSFVDNYHINNSDNNNMLSNKMVHLCQRTCPPQALDCF
jgi:hypothetical protein